MNYAIADIHGMYDIYEQVCKILKPEDKVYFLGDAGDRGPHGWRTIKAIYENPQWIYLKGNHEDLMVWGLSQKVAKRKLQDCFELWMYNGGFETYRSWKQDGADPIWISRINTLPLTAQYTNSQGTTFHLSHAGFTCGRKDEIQSDKLLWNRSHFFDKWDEDTYPKDICVHGHTPMEYLLDTLYAKKQDIEVTLPMAFSYCNGHKINIDNGVFYTNCTVLLNLDTLEVINLFSNSQEVE